VSAGPDDGWLGSSPGMVAVMSSTDGPPPSLRDRIVPAAHAWRPLVVGWLALFAVVTAAGMLLVGPFAEGRVARWDLQVARWFVDQRTSTGNSLAEAGTWLAETITVPAVLLVAVVVAWRISSNAAAPVFLALAVGGEKLLYLLSSLAIGRDRPPVPTVGTSYATSSFPSGHVASAVTLYGSIALLIALRRSAAVRAGLLIVVGAIATTVALCRMYTGFHYLSDSVAGALVGAVWLTVVYRSVLLPAEAALAQGWRPAKATSRSMGVASASTRTASANVSPSRSGGPMNSL
jgi:membrane-associated phospholipid phosphatase